MASPPPALPQISYPIEQHRQHHRSADKRPLPAGVDAEQAEADVRGIPMVTDEWVELWIIFGVAGGVCAYSWYWCIRSIIFYRKNGYDFSQDVGSKIYWSARGGDDRQLATPKAKLLIAMPFPCWQPLSCALHSSGPWRGLSSLVSVAAHSAWLIIRKASQ